MAKELLTKERVTKDLRLELARVRKKLVTVWQLSCLALPVLVLMLWLVISYIEPLGLLIFVLCCISLLAFEVLYIIISLTVSYRCVKRKIESYEIVISKDVLMERYIGEFQYRNAKLRKVSYRRSAFIKQRLYKRPGEPYRFTKEYFFESTKKYIPPYANIETAVTLANPKDEFYTVAFNDKPWEIYLVYSDDGFEYNEN